MAVLSTSANIATPGLPVGSIQAFAGANAPTGWLLCDGSAVSRGNYPDLYNTIGNTYGSGDGSTTFNLPDLRGRIPLGAGTGSQNGGSGSGTVSGGTSLTSRTRGQFGGDERLQSHTHYPMPSTQNRARIINLDSIIGHPNGFNTSENPYGSNNAYARADISTTGTVTTDTPVGTGGNMPPFLVTNYIIKATADIARGGWYTQSSPPVVTQLPSNPAIGEEVYHFQSGYIYHKRYNGTSWEKTVNDIIVCTSSTRPSSPPTGQQIFETNTGFVYMYNGASWLQMRQTSDAVDISLLPSGSVIQAVQRVSSTYQYVFNNFLYTECYCYITPLISTSKILCMASASIFTTSASDGGFGGGIYSNVGGQLIQVSRIGHGFDENGDEANSSGFTYLRTGHNTTSSHYYQFTADPYRNNSATGVYCNRSYQQTDYSVMTLLEIK